MENRREDRLSSRLTALAALGFLLFTPPLLSIFDRGTLVLSAPLVWAYVFLAWGGLIAAVAALVTRAEKRKD